MKRFLRILSLITALVLFAPACGERAAIFEQINAFATDGTSQTETTQAQDSEGQTDSSQNDSQNKQNQEQEEYKSQFTFPEQLRAVAITPGLDFAVSESPTNDEINAKLDEILKNAQAIGLNAVVINTDYNGKAFYSTDINETVEKTPVELAIKAAKDKGFFVYLTFDINFVLSQFENEPLQERIDYLALKAHTFTVKNAVDGIILEGYYSSKNKTSFDDYMQNGSGIGFENWLRDNGAYVFSLVSDAIRKTNNTVPVGIYLKDAWANASTNSLGSNTSDDFEALVDGYSDTLGYVQKGYADFIMLEAKGSLEDSKLPYNEFVSWWAKHALEVNIPLYVMHDNEKLCTSEQGWGSPDQIVQQLRAAAKIDGYKGSAFKSYQSLVQNPDSSTTVLTKYYDNTLNMETIDNQLTIISPQQREFTTEEPTVKFMGTFDSNFEVKFNGEVIKLNEAGNFYYEKDLDVGLNVFTIEHKGKTITYRITRKVTVLKSATPAPGNLNVEGSTNVSITAIAYKGSTVTATVNGKTIKLEPQEGTVEGYENSNYIRYTGVYTVPKGIINRAQNLGSISIYGKYTGKNGVAFTGSITGATIIVNALPEVPNNADGSLLRVRNDNTMVYNYSTSDKIPTPDQARLPAGVLDYCVKKVTFDSVNFYLTLSGKRLKATDVDVLENAPLGSNTIEAVSATMEGADTVVRIRQTVRTPFSMSFGGVSYAGGGSYAVSGFGANSISITFDYANSTAGGLSFPSGALFSSASWGDVYESGNVSRATLTLNFSRSGIYGGVKSYYDGDGTLVFRFKSCTGSLAGKTIVIDPGHGVKGSGFDYGAIGHVTEQSVVLAISKQLQAKLAAAGANAVRFNTESQYYDTEQRSNIARQYNPDLYIAVHANAVAGNSTTRGVEAWYFTPFSKPFASALSASVAGYYQNYVYMDGVNRNRGAKYDYFWVTTQQEFPSVLLEVGFVTNYEEAMAMNNPQHQSGIADAIVQGIQNYLSR